MIKRYFANLLAFLSVAVLFWLLDRIFSRDAPFRRTREGGAIRPSRLVITETLLLAMFLISGAGYYLQRVGDNIIAIGVLMTAIVMILIALFMTGEENEVSWSSEGMTGPGFLPFLPGLTKQVFLGWNEIRRTGETALHMRYVEGDCGRRIYWHRFYPGHGALEEALKDKRQDLFNDIGF